MALCGGDSAKRESDFEVCGEAHDGQDAIEKAQRLLPDLIILDLSMPVMNGLDAARVLKDRMPSVPIIMFTLYVDPFVEQESRSAGADVLSTYLYSWPKRVVFSTATLGDHFFSQSGNPSLSLFRRRRPASASSMA
jgi:CheY-like chemotaxis protein